MKEVLTYKELEEAMRLCPPEPLVMFRAEFGDEVGLVTLVERLHADGMHEDWEAWLLSRFPYLTESLVAVGANVDANNGSALCDAVERGKFLLVQSLVDHKANVGALNKQFTLAWLVAANRFAMAKLILSLGADVHAGEEEALRRAIFIGSMHGIEFLLDHGADVNKALQIAEQYENHNAIAFIEDKKKRIQATR